MGREPLARARRAQARAARQGFDWPPEDPRLWTKLLEEIAELYKVRRDRPRAREELGDLLFMVVNVSRHLGVDPADALARATGKFESRYAHVMRQARRLPRRGDPARLERMEELWQDAKRREARKRRAKVAARASRGGKRHAHRRRR